MLNIEIDGKQTQVENGRTVMEAANSLGIFIPYFCYHKKLSIAANCRMCLVQVEKAPKPLPACATPVTDGMKVQTNSDYAVSAQKGVMEFLLINHPLDCPICDQGGECQLQDLAVGYGSSGSRYTEEKRVVVNKNLGPLIATDMTRCIHCTRCVRFGEEIAGIMELGMAGRGEAAEILTFVGRTVDSEISGNVIDLCPVGALTSKPFRYTARPWELSRRKSVSPHDGLGSNLVVQVKQDRVMRVLPRENDAINECWLSDRDRFSYEGLNSTERLTRPMLKQGGQWQEVDWQVALECVADGLRDIAARHGAEALGALATPHQTLEELYLLQKLTRSLGSNNVDFRLRQSDFSADGKQAGAPYLGMAIAELNRLKSVLVLGSTLRHDHPLISQRFRQAVKKGCVFNLINPVDDELLMAVANKMIVAPGALVDTLAQVLKAVAQAKQAVLPKDLAKAADIQVGEVAGAIAASLIKGGNSAVFLGNLAEHHPRRATLQRMAVVIAELSGAVFGFLGEAANSVGGYVINALPVGGLNAQEMLRNPRKAYLLLGVEAELDCYDAQLTLHAMQAAEMVVAMSAYKHKAFDYANVLLPIAPFTETAGTFVSTEGRVQSFNGVVRPLGEARPAWKVLRVLGNLLGRPGFEYEELQAVRDEIAADLETFVEGQLSNRLSGVAVRLDDEPLSVQRIGEVPIYQTDSIVRRAPALQKTRAAAPAVASLPGSLLEQLQMKDGENLRVTQGKANVTLRAARDDGLPAGCVRLPGAHPDTAMLGALFGELQVERA